MQIGGTSKRWDPDCTARPFDEVEPKWPSVLDQAGINMNTIKDQPHRGWSFVDI